MARTCFTARKRLTSHARPEAVIRAFQTYQICHRDSLSTFVSEYGRLWMEAHRYGTTAYDGMVRLTYLLPEEWRTWARATGRLFIRRDYPTYDLIYDAIGYFGAMYSDCLRYGRVPPPVTEVPVGPQHEDFPLWTFTSDPGRPMYEGESSRPPRGKRQRTEDDSSSEMARKGKGRVVEESEAESEDDTEEEDPEELETEILEPAATAFTPPPPSGPPPEIPPPPTETTSEAPRHSPSHDMTFFTRMREQIARLREESARSRERTAEMLREFQAAPERPEHVTVPVVPEELLSPIRAVGPSGAHGDPIVIDSDSDSDDGPPEIATEISSASRIHVWILDD